MKLYEIKNDDYGTKRVAAENMGEALSKYRDYLDNHIRIDYSSQEVYNKVTSCELIGEYQEDDIIV